MGVENLNNNEGHQGSQTNTELLDLALALSGNGHESLSTLIEEIAKESKDLNDQNLSEIQSAFRQSMKEMDSNESAELQIALEYIESLQVPETEVISPEITQKNPQETMANGIWDALSPSTGTDGRFMGNGGLILNQLFLPKGLDPGLNNLNTYRANYEDRPDPALRTYLYYRKTIQIQPENLAYTGISPQNLKSIQNILEKGFISPGESGGGGIGLVKERGEDILYKFSGMPNEYKQGILDTTYSETIGIIEEALSTDLDLSTDKMGAAMNAKALFDAQFDSFGWRLNNSENLLGAALKTDLYETHPKKIREAAHLYMKSLNVLAKTEDGPNPIGKEIRNSILREDILPKLYAQQKRLENIPQSQDEYENLTNLIQLAERSLGVPNSPSDLFTLDPSENPNTTPG
jgi:hypothetical protein